MNFSITHLNKQLYKYSTYAEYYNALLEGKPFMNIDGDREQQNNVYTLESLVGKEIFHLKINRVKQNSVYAFLFNDRIEIINCQNRYPSQTTWFNVSIAFTKK